MKKILFVGTFLTIILMAVSAVLVQNPAEPKHKVDAYQQLQFVETTASTHRLTNTELLDAAEMFSAYSQGAAILPLYRDPVDTRGAKGVALFRSVAPAVTLVVVGNENRIEGLGTGALVRADGYVLTNWHVITGHAAAVVFLKPTSSAEVTDAAAFGARVIYQDSTVDLALLKLVQPNPATLPAIPVADLSTIEVAEDVHIIGHPRGELWSYSTGVISQIRNNYEWTYSDGSHHRARVLQMQTAINPGNSGGPVLNDSGSMLGLVAMAGEGQNLDYAIAADVIQGFLRQAFATRSRGQAGAAEQSPEHTYVGKTDNNDRVSKLVIGSSTVYWLSTPQIQDAEVFVVDQKGNVVHGEHPNSGGGFTDWSASGGIGTIHATSDGRVPQVFGGKQVTNPPPG